MSKVKVVLIVESAIENTEVYVDLEESVCSSCGAMFGTEQIYVGNYEKA